MLRLEVLDYAGPTQWRWRLTKASSGAVVASHAVELDPGEWQYEAFTDLDHYLRWHAVPDRRLDHEAELITRVGQWITNRVLGPIAPALAATRLPVRLDVPAEAAVLANRPWDTARVDGLSLAAHRVSIVITQLPHAERDKSPVGKRLRMLGLFSLPEGVGALNLRKERYALARLVHEIAAVNNKSIELRVLQYGATRARLKDALLEQDGWDVVHLSGHGLPAGLLLEDDSGQRDLITSTELVDLLDLASDQIKLVTLSACESATASANEHLRKLGIDLVAPTHAADPLEPGPLPAVATEVMRRLDCAVLAMRYPVVDDFAVDLSHSFYNLVLGKGQPVARALTLTMSEMVAEPPTPSAPALATATPALFGARATGLRLAPPPGGPLVFQAEHQKLAEFPAQPERFVGRVGPMTQATTALAPRSGKAGVLFHGMAGAGKTACALELAYTHQDSFALVAWHAAPPEGNDIATALTDFAFALERQLPGLKLVHLISDVTALKQALPGLTKALDQHRVLIVLDNIESLLAESGSWRDDRWRLLINAITSHNGLSRLILTSRRRPSKLSGSMLIEPVHALSLSEAVLLAREWPHLRTLIDSPHSRGLAARTLAVVQGHPKLIELAGGLATNAAELTKRLDATDDTWLAHGTTLEPFLRGAEPTATDDDYLAVLDQWTRTTITALSPDSASLFQFLCSLEQGDRGREVVAEIWALWHAFERQEVPDLDRALAPLVHQALVAVSTNRYLIHPALATTGRSSARPDWISSVETAVGTYWLAVLHDALEHEQNEQLGWLVLRTARAAAPYLLRRHRWEELATAAVMVLQRTKSPGTVAALVPALATAADATRDTRLGLLIANAHARALSEIHAGQAETLLRSLLESAVAQQNFEQATALANDLIELLRGSGHLDQALLLADRRADHIDRAGLGPWTKLSNEVLRLQILSLKGHNRQVLADIEKHRATMANLPDTSGSPNETVSSWNVREEMLTAGVVAANRCGQWQRALELNTEVLQNMERRGASSVELAKHTFNDYAPLIVTGRVTDARERLRWCRAVFEAENRADLLGRVIAALADVEKELGHLDRAIDLCAESLRFHYATSDPQSAMVGHSKLSQYLNSSTADFGQVCAHALASAIIAYQIGSGHDTNTGPVSYMVGAGLPLPESFGEVCEIVDRIEGVHLADLVARLPARARDGQAAMDEVIRLAKQSLKNP